MLLPRGDTQPPPQHLCSTASPPQQGRAQTDCKTPPVTLSAGPLCPSCPCPPLPPTSRVTSPACRRKSVLPASSFWTSSDLINSFRKGQARRTNPNQSFGSRTTRAHDGSPPRRAGAPRFSRAPKAPRRARRCEAHASCSWGSRGHPVDSPGQLLPTWPAPPSPTPPLCATLCQGALGRQQHPSTPKPPALRWASAPRPHRRRPAWWVEDEARPCLRLPRCCSEPPSPGHLPRQVSQQPCSPRRVLPGPSTTLERCRGPGRVPGLWAAGTSWSPLLVHARRTPTRQRMLTESRVLACLCPQPPARPGSDL